jgi:hypothetical protein
VNRSTKSGATVASGSNGDISLNVAEEVILLTDPSLSPENLSPSLRREAVRLANRMRFKVEGVQTVHDYMK